MTAGDGPVEAARAAVLERLRARQTELVDAIFARVCSDAFAPPGGYGSSGAGDAEYLAGLRAAVAAAVDYVLEGLQLGEESAGQVPALASEQARRAARIGVPLDTVLRRYMAGQALLGDYILREAERAGRDDLPRELLRVQASLVDRLARGVSQAHSDERDDQAGEGVAPLPALLAHPSAHRARQCLRFLAAHPDSANREVAAGIGVTNQPQISRLLSQLAAEGLVSKRSQGAGKRNVLRLTQRGEQVLRMLLARRV